MFAFEFLRMRKKIAQLLDVARKAVGLASRPGFERGETGAVAHENVGLVIHLKTVEERAREAAALAFRVKLDGLLKTVRRELALPRVVGVKLRENVRLRRATLCGSQRGMWAGPVIESALSCRAGAPPPIGPWSYFPHCYGCSSCQSKTACRPLR